MPEKISVILVEDHPEYRDVIELACNKEPDLELGFLFGTAERALSKVQYLPKDERPAIALLDLNLPGMSGLDAIPWFRKYSPETKLIILTQSDMEEDILRAIRRGASGYLLKSATVTEIIEGIRSVMAGGAPLDAGVAKLILDTLKTEPPADRAVAALSDRETEILTLLAEGLMKKEIAARLEIGTSTVVTHVTHIYEKLGVANAPSAIHKAHRLGLFPSDDTT